MLPIIAAQTMMLSSLTGAAGNTGKRRIAGSPLVLLTSCLLGLCASIGQAATYYVATNGNDNLAGTNLATAWKTISKGAANLNAGDTVLIRGGTYREKVVPAQGGSSAGGRITYQNYSNEVPVLSGADVFTNWTWDTSGSPAAWQIPWSLSLPSSDPKFADDPTVLRREMVIFDGQVMRPVGSRSQLTNGSFWASGADTNPIALLALFPGGLSPTGHVVEVATRSNIFVGSGKSWLHVSGLTFQYGCNASQGSLVTVSGNNNLIESNIIQWANSDGLAATGSNNVFAFNRVQNNGEMGFHGGGTANLYDHNLSLSNNWKGYDTGWGSGGGKWAYGFSSTIRCHTAAYNTGPGIWLDVTNFNNVIERCFCISNTSWGIKVELWSVSNVVQNNVIFSSQLNTLYETNFGGGIELLDATGNTIANNTIYDCASDGIWIKNDNRVPTNFLGNNRIINNLVAFNATAGGTASGRGYQIELRGLNLADAKSNFHDGNLYWRGASPGSTFYFQGQSGTDNLSTWQGWSGGDSNAVVANPLLADATAGNGFHLTASSPARGLGVAPPVAITNGYDGDPRPATDPDTGADQFVPAAPVTLTATASNAQVLLSWTVSAGADAYNLKRSTTNGGPYFTLTNLLGAQFNDTGLKNGTTYYYVVSATVAAGGESANSPQASATPVAPPPAPRGLNAGVFGNQVSLNWNAAASASSYNVKRSTTNGGPYPVVASTVPTNYTDGIMVNGAAYYYVVSALNAGGESTNSSQTVVIPQPPQLSLASAGSNEVSLSWPGWATNFALYSTPSLAPPTNWHRVTNIPLSTGGVFNLVLPVTTNAKLFFRQQLQ